MILRRRLIHFIATAPLPLQLFVKALDYALVLGLIYGAYRLFRHYQHRLPSRAWDNY